MRPKSKQRISIQIPRGCAKRTPWLDSVKLWGLEFEVKALVGFHQGLQVYEGLVRKHRKNSELQLFIITMDLSLDTSASCPVGAC